MARIIVTKNRARYVLINPCCALLVVVTRDILIEVTALGPVFSSQVWSVIWEATICPKLRLSFGERRCIMGGKNPSRLENR